VKVVVRISCGGEVKPLGPSLYTPAKSIESIESIILFKIMAVQISELQTRVASYGLCMLCWQGTRGSVRSNKYHIWQLWHGCVRRKSRLAGFL
jgi:hypothetical protein